MIDTILYSLRSKALIAILNHIKEGQLRLTMPDGSVHEFKGSGSLKADMHIHTKAALGRIMADGKMGFCEAFMAGEVTSHDLPKLIELATKQNNYVEKNLKFSGLKTFMRQVLHRLNANTKTGSRKNISAHYDLGNSFYDKWLDDSMTYSSAFFEKDDDDLKTAQIAKYRRLAEMADLKAGDHVLEIGCGWGGFAEFAASTYDIKMTAITISQEQFDFARQRMIDNGDNWLSMLETVSTDRIRVEMAKIFKHHPTEGVRALAGLPEDALPALFGGPLWLKPTTEKKRRDNR